MTFVLAGSNDNHCLNLALENGGEINFAEVFEKYGIVLLMQETSEQELADLDGELPTDTHLVRYAFPVGAVGCDAVRAFTKVDIFDAYHDAGLTVLEISSGWGRIKPKLFTDARKGQ